MSQRPVERDGVRLAGEEAGEGIPVVLLHGLTATRRYVVMGSRALERSGHRVIAYDARGHGRSDPARSKGEYDYVNLAGDLEAVLDAHEVPRAALAGASMGAHTAAAFALERPERVGALALITPAFDPDRAGDAEAAARWDELAEALRRGGPEGFVAAFDAEDVPEKWRETVLKVVRQRLSEHEHPDAVADALEVVPRAAPFERWEDLGRVDVPAVVVASRDEADPQHPYAVGERWASELRAGKLVSERPGESPLAWQGGRVSRLIADVVSEAARAGDFG